MSDNTRTRALRRPVLQPAPWQQTAGTGVGLRPSFFGTSLGRASLVGGAVFLIANQFVGPTLAAGVASSAAFFTWHAQETVTPTVGADPRWPGTQTRPFGPLLPTGPGAALLGRPHDPPAAARY